MRLLLRLMRHWGVATLWVFAAWGVTSLPLLFMHSDKFPGLLLRSIHLVLGGVLIGHTWPPTQDEAS